MCYRIIHLTICITETLKPADFTKFVVVKNAGVLQQWSLNLFYSRNDAVIGIFRSGEKLSKRTHIAL